MTKMRQSPSGTKFIELKQGRNFLIGIFPVAIVAAVISTITLALGLKIWAMFIAWTAFGLGNKTLLGGSYAIASMFAGVAIGMLVFPAMGTVSSISPALALPVAVFMAVVLAMGITLTKPVDNVPACFLGMSTMFASNMDPGLKTYLHLAAAILLGAAAAATIHLCARSQAKHEPTVE